MTGQAITNDTDPWADRLVIDAMRRLSGPERLQRARDLSLLASVFAMADIRRHHPDADARECLLRLASRRMDPETLRHLVGRDVGEQGH